MGRPVATQSMATKTSKRSSEGSEVSMVDGDGEARRPSRQHRDQLAELGKREPGPSAAPLRQCRCAFGEEAGEEYDQRGLAVSPGWNWSVSGPTTSRTQRRDPFCSKPWRGSGPLLGRAQATGERWPPAGRCTGSGGAAPTTLPHQQEQADGEAGADQQPPPLQSGPGGVEPVHHGEPDGAEQGGQRQQQRVGVWCRLPYGIVDPAKCDEELGGRWAQPWRRNRCPPPARPARPPASPVRATTINPASAVLGIRIVRFAHSDGGRRTADGGQHGVTPRASRWRR